MIMTFKLKVLAHAKDVVTMQGYCYAFAKGVLSGF